MALWAKHARSKKISLRKSSAPGGPFPDPATHSAGLNIKQFYDGARVVKEKLRLGEAPYAGVTRGMAPRAPNIFLFPVRNKEVSRIDWRDPSNVIFTTDQYQAAYKRFYQLVYGTPRVEARRGGLDPGYGHMAMRGLPIHQGHIQHWLSMTPGQPSSPSMDFDLKNPNRVVNQRDLLPWIPS